MAEEDKEQKSEEATTKRARETEERGQFALSREINSAFILMGSVLALTLSGRQSMARLGNTWTTMFTEAAQHPLTVESSRMFLIWILENMAMIMGPILITIMIVGIVANLIQTQGLKFSMHPLTPNFAKINPLAGMGRVISKQSLAELFKSLFKISIVSAIVYQVIHARFFEIPGLVELSIGQIMSYMGEVSIEIMVKVLLFLGVLSIFDYAFQIFMHKEGMRMTKQEVKQERKETEGDPLVKQRIRSAQVQMARKRMMAAVPKADVVVTNPTHISVAIRYDRERHEAPVVVAKGKGYVASKIRELARQHGIPLVEDKPLARTLYKTVDIGQYIPAALYKAVAQILAYVYRLKNRTTV